MKINLFVTIFLFSLTVLAGPSDSVETELSLAQPFEFLHCIPSGAKKNDSVVHYILDIKNNSVNALYVTSGLQSLKAAELQKLSLIENTFENINTDLKSDISLDSIKNNLSFRLTITDNDGFVLNGYVITKTDEVALLCNDVSYSH